MKQSLLGILKSTLQKVTPEQIHKVQGYDIDDIILRLLFALGSDSEQALAKWLDMSVDEMQQWKTQEELPFDAIFKVAKHTGVSMGWMITGECARFEASLVDEKNYHGVLLQCNGHILVSQLGAISYMRKEISNMVSEGKLELLEVFTAAHFAWLGKSFYESLLHELKKHRPDITADNSTNNATNNETNNATESESEQQSKVVSFPTKK
ncbi:helix-turn-helix domain-containing protein [Paraneptunicella aestuarii]|uniref:helix-turn-helix domain-containing protein n=1 Tax=Paraneptunicella aestuarii TaxID=2831148 RepID=UPI001E5D3589|nr:helix-turn-helix domain-containing protein [Paraneptunicella aestuarii]UAA39831.1 helix-turn-helix domain-containing protein [Paraneptunicella aestuarii]